MRIGIDARPLIKKKTGVGYYLYYLLENILKYDTENEYFLFSDREVYFDKSKYDNLTVIVDKESRTKKTIWYLFNIDKLCKKNKIDVFWGTQHVLPLNMKNVKTVLTVHDLVAFDFKETMSTYNKIINKLLIPRSLSKADKIISVSNSTKERLKANFPNINEDKNIVIYEDVIVNKEYSSVDKEKFTKLGIKSKKYIMFLGTIEPRKNIKTLIKALDEINKNTGMKLVICGKYGWKCEEEKNLIELNKENIVFLDYVTDEEKNYLMNQCFLFVFPSLYEGFGLPVLEAMRNETVVMVANNTSLSEIVEKEELKFETLNTSQLKAKIVELYNNQKLYTECLAYCQRRQNDFSWDDIAKKYINELTRG